MASQTRLRPDALTWLAARNPDRWIKRSGKPHITRIAAEASVGRVSIHEMLRGHRLPGRAVQDRLRDLAVTTGVSHADASNALFEAVELDDTQTPA